LAQEIRVIRGGRGAFDFVFGKPPGVHGVEDNGQVEIHTAEPQVPEPSAFEVELAIEKIKVTNHQGLIRSQQN
jgi:hypothetical protein